MKIFKYQKPEIEENYVELYYGKLDQETENMIKYLDSCNKTLTGRKEDETTLINPGDIYYCEIVDRKCYAYLKESVWQIDIPLQTVLNKYGSLGFVRIGKSMVANIYKIDKVKSDFNMRVNLIMDNGEVVILSRTYKNRFYQYLEEMRREMK